MHPTKVRWRPCGLLLVAVALLGGVGCSGAAQAATHARYGCFRFRVEPATPTGDAVLAARVVATNVTTTTCPGPRCGGVTGGFVVTNASGHAVKHEGPAGVMCRSNPPPPQQVAPAASVVWASIQWDGLGDLAGPRCVPGDCHLTRPRAKPGHYRVTWTWLDVVRVHSGLIGVR